MTLKLVTLTGPDLSYCTLPEITEDKILTETYKTSRQVRDYCIKQGDKIWVTGYVDKGKLYAPVTIDIAPLNVKSKFLKIQAAGLFVSSGVLSSTFLFNVPIILAVIVALIIVSITAAKTSLTRKKSQ